MSVNEVELNKELFDKLKERILYELNYWDIDYDPDDITLESDLYDIGLDRSDVITICCELSEKFNILILNLERMEDLETIGDMYNHFNGRDK